MTRVNERVDYRICTNLSEVPATPSAPTHKCITVVFEFNGLFITTGCRMTWALKLLFEWWVGRKPEEQVSLAPGMQVPFLGYTLSVCGLTLDTCSAEYCSSVLMSAVPRRWSRGFSPIRGMSRARSWSHGPTPLSTRICGMASVLVQSIISQLALTVLRVLLWEVECSTPLATVPEFVSRVRTLSHLIRSGLPITGLRYTLSVLCRTPCPMFFGVSIEYVCHGPL